MRVIRTDLLDRRAWEHALDFSAPLAEMVEEAEAENNGLDDMVADLFQATLQRVPVFDPPHSLTLAEHILREITETPEFRQLKAAVRGDIISATLVTTHMGAELKNRLDAVSKKEIEEQHRFEDEDGEVADGREGGIPTGIDNERVGRIRRVMREQAKKAQQQVEDLNQAEDMLGGKSGHSLEEKLALAQRVGRSQKLKLLIEQAGRLRRVALAKKASVVQEVPQETVGIRFGDEITQVVPSELALLSNPTTAPLFYKKLVEKQLMLWDKQGEEKLGGGPIVLLIDGSTSMVGKRELWAKSIMMAYLAVAEKEKRDLHVLQFADTNRTLEWHFPFKSGPAVKRGDILDAVETFIGGGTDLENPLRWAVQQIKVPATNPKTAADIVVLTDAECRFDPTFIKEFGQEQARLGFKTQGVLIGSSEYMPHFKQVCAETTAVSDLTKDEEVTDLLFKR